MKTAFVFSLMESHFVKPRVESVASAGSVSRVVLPEGCSLLLAYDPECTDRETIDSVKRMLPGFSDIAVPPVTRSLQDWGCRQMDFIAAAIDGSDFDAVMSMPSNWMCSSRIDVRIPFKVVGLENVLSVFFGGCPTAHVDEGSVFDWADAPVPRYSRLRTRSFDFIGLDRMDCPCVVNVPLFRTLYGSEMRRLNSLSRCGWDPVYQVLYPDSLSREPGDGKPEVFRDLVGISPDLWTHSPLTDDERKEIENGGVI